MIVPVHHVPAQSSVVPPKAKGYGYPPKHTYLPAVQHNSLFTAPRFGTDKEVHRTGETKFIHVLQHAAAPFRELLQGLALAVRRFGQWLGNVWFRIMRMVSPVSVPQLRDALNPLMVQAQHRFPIPMVRAKLLKEGSPDALLPYRELERRYRRNPEQRVRLLENFVTSEATAYLASHLLALQEAIRNPGQPLRIDRSHIPAAVRMGVDDANAIVARRTKELLYAKDKQPIADNLYNLILESPKVALHEHYRGCAPMAMVRAWFMAQNDPIAFKSNDELEEYCRIDRLFTPDGEGPLYQPSLDRYRWKNDNIVSVSINSTETAYMAAYMYTLRSGLENVRYFEYRLNPISKGVKDSIAYAKAIQQGIHDGKMFLKESRGQDIDANLIYSADRQPKPGVEVNNPLAPKIDDRIWLAMKIIVLAIKSRLMGMHVTGFDVQGSEANYAIMDFEPVARMLARWNRVAKAMNQMKMPGWEKDYRVGATLHSGETPLSGLISHKDAPITGAESVERSVELFTRKDTSPMNLMAVGQAIQQLLKTPDTQLDDATTLRVIDLLLPKEDRRKLGTSRGALKAESQAMPAPNELPPDQDPDIDTPVRIGHGVQLKFGPRWLIDACWKHKIGFEQCPKSNVQTGAVSYYNELPTLVMSRPRDEGHGLMVSISRDNGTTSKTNMPNELVKLTRHLKARHEDRKRFQINGIQTAFLFDPELKTKIRQEMLQRFHRLESRPAYGEVIRHEQDPRLFKRLIENRRGAHTA